MRHERQHGTPTPEQEGWHGSPWHYAPQGGPAHSQVPPTGQDGAAFVDGGQALTGRQGRLLVRGKRPGRLSLELAPAVAIATVILPFIRDVTWPMAAMIGAGTWVVFTVLLLLWGRGRVQITGDEVRIRSWSGTRTIERRAIAQVVYVRDLQVLSIEEGYVALLDFAGKPLWRYPSQYWSPETIQALLASGGEPVVVGRLTSAQAQAYWPSMLTWQLRNPGKAVLAGIGGVVAVVAAVVLTLVVVNL